MPSLKMKTKSTTGCLREKNGLHVCQKSSIICKHSVSRVKISEQAAEFEDSIQNNKDVSLCNDPCAKEIYDDATVDDRLLVGENCQIQIPSIESETAGRMDSTPTPCLSNMETIFSPSLECNNMHSEQNVHVDGEINKDSPLPQLGAGDSDDNSRSSCEYQSCNVSDFYISDMIVSVLPIETNSEYDDITETTSFPDYKCNEPSTFFDMADDYMMLPLLEDTLDTGNGLDSRTCEESTLVSDNSNLYLAVHQLTYGNQESNVDNFLESDQECFDPHIFIRSLSDIPEAVPNFQPTILSKDIARTRSITLVLDLDETLVHSTLELCDDADFTFPVYFNMKEHIVYVKQRPHLMIFLERVAEMFEIVIFTASQSIYAKQLLDILDPDGKLISRRAYRESCIFSDGTYTKDLTVLGVDLAKVAIVDNSPQVFRLQVNNGIPIKSWFDDPSDTALISLLPFLETLADVDDVRPIIAKRFGNKE